MDNNEHNSLIKKESGALMKHPGLMEKVVAPVSDIFETSDAFVVKLDMPGATKESINLSVEPNLLKVQARIVPLREINVKLIFSEIGFKSYFREFNLSNGIEHEKIVAQFENGVLTITLPKSDTIKAKEIHIN